MYHIIPISRNNLTKFLQSNLKDIHRFHGVFDNSLFRQISHEGRKEQIRLESLKN